MGIYLFKASQKGLRCFKKTNRAAADNATARIVFAFTYAGIVPTTPLTNQLMFQISSSVILTPSATLSSPF